MSVTFADILAMLDARPPLASAAPCHLVKNITALKSDCIQLSTAWTVVVENLAQIQQKNWPQIKHPRLALYASNYGGDITALQQKLQELNTQKDPLTRLCAMLNADLRVYELDLSTQIPGSGIDEVQACHAISYGLMSVEEHVDSLIVDTLSPGAEQILTTWENALRSNQKDNPLTLLLQAGGGHDLFALLGAVFAARMAKIPVFGTARLNDVILLAMARMLPDEMPVYQVMPEIFSAPDVVQTMAALQNLQFILALGPQSDPRLVMPKAA